MGIEMFSDPAAIFAPGSVSLKIVVRESEDPGAFRKGTGPLPGLRWKVPALLPFTGLLHQRHSPQRLPENGVVKLPGRLEAGRKEMLIPSVHRQRKFQDEGRGRVFRHAARWTA